MRRLRRDDPTRRHAQVTLVLVAVAALVVLAIDDPSRRKADWDAAPRMAVGTPMPPARQPPYRQFGSPARVVTHPMVKGVAAPTLVGKH